MQVPDSAAAVCSVIWDATSLRREHRAAVLQLGFEYHALVSLVAFQISETDLARRNRGRAAAVPEQVLDHQLRVVAWPYLDEAHELVVIPGSTSPPGGDSS